MALETSRGLRFGLGLKLSLFVTVLVVAISGSMAYFLISQSADARRAAMERRVESLATIIGGMRGSGYERRYDPGLIKLYVEQSHRMGTDLLFAIFLDAEGRLEGGNLNPQLLAEAAPGLAAELEGLAAPDQLHRLAGWQWTGEDVLDYRIRLKGQQGQDLGFARLGFSTVDMLAAIQEAIQTNLVVTAAAFLLALLSALIFSRQFVRPIKTVAAAMERVSAGDLEQQLLVASRDEVGVLARSFNFMTRGLRERERIRNTFARYVSDQVAERILKEEDELDLAGELRQVTVLFLDIRGFTSVTEYFRPREVVSLLNDYFEIIIEIVFRHEGTVNKFIGDSIMAIYGAPTSLDLPQLRAVMTAVDIQRAVGEFNWRRMQAGKAVVNFGIGIHTGEAIAGNIGSALRMEYTVIGRDVNLAQRIESATREGQVLISEATARYLHGQVELQKKEAVSMKGIAGPIQLYEVIGLKPDGIEQARARSIVVEERTA